MNNTNVNAINRSERNYTILVFVVVGLLWLVTPYILIFIIPSLENRALWGDAFGILNTLYSGLAFAGLLYTIMLQRQQLELQQKEISDTQKELIKERTATVFIEVLHILNELRPMWHKLYAFDDDFKKWNKKELVLADKLGVDLQRVSYLCLSGLIDKNYIMGNHANTFIKCWNKLDRYIYDYRIKCNEPPEIKDGAFQRRHLEIFAGMCKEYIDKKIYLNDFVE